MHRTQIYLTEIQRKALQSIARRLRRSQSDLIRSAVDEYIRQQTPQGRIELLRKGHAIWQGRRDLPSLRVLRREFDRLAH
jgi:Arc/MetJ-type ribon-helix-helix transcriptional regulator